MYVSVPTAKNYTRWDRSEASDEEDDVIALGELRKWVDLSGWENKQRHLEQGYGHRRRGKPYWRRKPDAVTQCYDDQLSLKLFTIVFFGGKVSSGSNKHERFIWYRMPSSDRSRGRGRIVPGRLFPMSSTICPRSKSRKHFLILLDCRLC